MVLATRLHIHQLVSFNTKMQVNSKICFLLPQTSKYFIDRIIFSQHDIMGELKRACHMIKQVSRGKLSYDLDNYYLVGFKEYP